ncbi:MAG: hypothetical protein ACREC4_00345 [Methylocella sp.]
MAKPPKVTIHGAENGGSFSQDIKQAGNRIELLTSEKGRQVGVKMLNPLDVFRITLMMGTAADNQMAFLQGLRVCSIVSLDSEPVTRPATMLQLEAMLQRVDFDILNAVSKALERFSAAQEETEEAVKN